MSQLDLNRIIHSSEGRRLEFKETLPKGEELAKTVIAFSNDAGGEIFVGIKNEPHKVVGIPDEMLFRTEEQIANIIADFCEPTILPEITFLAVEDKTIIRVKIYRGSQVPYYLKSVGKLKLIKEINGQEHPTNAALLFCSSEHKQKLFPYAKIECARFKGTKTEEFLDQATIKSSVVCQPEEVVHFVQRNIAKGATLDGIYREERWEYPLLAIREAVINAIVHRDYSLSGKDIKVAVFDDMLEITSAGTLSPSIDITELSGGQSEIRNRVLAPIFKKLGLIEQWGTGFRKIQEALKEYPNIELRFNETGIAFQMQFVKKDYQPESKQTPHEYPTSALQVPSKYRASTEQVRKILNFCIEAKSSREIQSYLKLKHREHFRSAILKPLLGEGFLEMLYPNAPNSPRQKYITTQKGKKLFKSLEE